MSDDAHGPEAMARAEKSLRREPREGAPPTGRTDDTAEASPTGLQVADSWAEAADQDGSVEARREMPEPDSLGG